jgi:hypothetical protein
MTSVGRVERAIKRTEGFNVRIRHLAGPDVRSDRTGMPPWPFERAAKDAWSVSDWKRRRFAPTYPGFMVDVLDAAREVAAGQTRLENVRATYAKR